MNQHLESTKIIDWENSTIKSLSQKLSEEEIKRLLKDGSVNSRIFLDPPLENVLADPDEKPDEDSTMRIIAKVRSSRDSDPRETLINLGEILRKEYMTNALTGSEQNQNLEIMKFYH
ncbi:MAG: hypothetical protein ACE5KZ_01380 [Candidatus Scalinduaceae bacterium]